MATPKILIVDDVTSNILALRKLLRKTNCEVIEATSGNAALAKCLENDFALILLDVEMPEMSGYEVVQYLKGEISTRHIPIIFVTASYEDMDHQKRGYEVGAVDYIMKPIDDFILLSKVSIFLDLYNSRQQLDREFARSEAMRVAASVSEARFRQALTDAPIPVMLHAEGGEVMLISRVWSELSGYEQKDIRTVRDWIAKAYDKERRESANEYFRQLYERTEWSADYECDVLSRSGDTLIWDFRSEPLAPLSDGRRLIISMAVDVTQRKRAEKALTSESNKNAMLLRSASDGIYIRDIKGNLIQVNDTFCRLVGYSNDALSEMNLVQLDPEHTAEEIESRFSSISEVGELFETQLYHSDGHPIDVEINAARIEINGIPMIYASVRDITERREKEEAQRLAVTVFNTVGDGVTVTDAFNNIVSINPAFTEITGYSAEEVMGKNPRILASGKHSIEFYREFWITLATTGFWHGEIWNRRKDGEVYLEWLSVRCVHDRKGVIKHYVGVFSDITKKKQSEELIWRQANYDTLTQLPNRRMFRDRLDQEVRKANRTNQQMALMFIDLDHFKEVNDTMGHEKGDLLLIEAARRISDCVRSVDTVARLGGDEFTVLLTDLDNTDSIERVAQEIVLRLAEPFSLGDENAYVSGSVGIAIYPNDASNIEDLFKCADQAMYVAKEAGRNHHEFYSHDLQETAQKRARLLNDLRAALANGEFRLYYQPIVNLLTGQIEKAEALIRWQHPTLGLLNPDEFIPLAEESGLINSIGDWVFREAASQILRWSALLHRQMKISVNVSPVQFKHSSALTSTWGSHLRDIGLTGRCINAEITEGLLLDASQTILDRLLEFRDVGIQVSLDDFGTGYSALAYLKKFDIDFLKIDQSFIRNLAPDSDDMALCEAIIVMAHKLGLKVIAEGVETDQQCTLLANSNCDYAQGYLFSHPVPADEFEAFVISKSINPSLRERQGSEN